MQDLLEALNEVVSKMWGKRMTQEQKRFLKELQRKVKVKEITREQAREIWNKKYRFITVEKKEAS